MSENELSVIDTMATSLPAVQYSAEQWASRRQQFNGWVNTQLKKGTDYGEIPGVDKPTLLKPGAEKIAQLFGCVANATVTHRESDATTGYLYVEVRVDLVNLQTGVSIGAGIGSCSSYESKYRWRWEWWNANSKPTGDEWEIFRKRNGSTSYRRRIENRDLADQWNTVIKIAKKRALVDAALTISGASEKFTQDVEDIVEAEFTPEPQPAPQPTAQPAPETPKAAEPKDNGWMKDAKARGAFWAWCTEQGLSHSEVHAALKVESLNDYQGDKKQARDAIAAFIASKSQVQEAAQ